MKKLLNPLTWAIDDALIFVGAFGLATGVGGKYFFLIPVAEMGSTWPGWSGTSLWSLNVPGAATNKSDPGSYPGAVDEELAVSLSFMFNLKAGFFGLDQWTAWQPINSGETLWEREASVPLKPGVLGTSGGYFFLALMAGGLLLKYA